ncbi:MAG: RidA family protein [Deltaproteobacteria bacterium]|nr:RidA family protein [Deltaproteobacteria bacterium]
MREVINPPGVTDAPKYGWSHAVKASGPLLFVSGQVAYDDRGNIVGRNDMKRQLERAFENLRTVVTAGGSTLEKIVKLTIYVTDVDAYRLASKEVWGKFFKQDFPGVTLIGTPKLFSAGLLVEIEAVAAIED